MAWSDPPTENQINALGREYDAIFYDLITEHENVLDDGFTKEAAKQIKTRREISEELSQACHGRIMNSEARAWLKRYFEAKSLKVEF